MLELWLQLIPKGRRSYSTDLWPLAVWKSGIINSSEFLVVLVETADLLTNFDVKYAEAHPVMHLNTKTASRRCSCCLTGSQHYMPGIEYIFAKCRSYIWAQKPVQIFALKCPCYCHLKVKYVMSTSIFLSTARKKPV